MTIIIPKSIRFANELVPGELKLKVPFLSTWLFVVLLYTDFMTLEHLHMHVTIDFNKS